MTALPEHYANVRRNWGHLVTTTNAYDRGAIMREAWAKFRAAWPTYDLSGDTPAQIERLRRSVFRNILSNVWADAKRARYELRDAPVVVEVVEFEWRLAARPAPFPTSLNCSPSPRLFVRSLVGLRLKSREMDDGSPGPNLRDRIRA